jgi:hypothetical protein
MAEPIEQSMDVDMVCMDLTVPERSMNMSISIDKSYNLVVCKDCGIGLPFEWVLSHLRELHGMKATLEQASRFLGLEHDAMTILEARDWISSVSIGRAVQNIPVIKGYTYIKCHYSAAKIKVMTNHFSKDYKGLIASKHCTECKVQLMFKGGLQKYIQVEDYDKMEINFECDFE